MDAFKRALPPAGASGYRNPALTADAVVFRRDGGGAREVLLIRRANPPFQGCLALPGGFVDYNEDPRDAALRELHEETTLTGQAARLVGVYGKPQRDPRQHIVTVAFLVDVADVSTLAAADDAASAHWVATDSLQPADLAFDHFDILSDALRLADHPH